MSLLHGGVNFSLTRALIDVDAWLLVFGSGFILGSIGDEGSLDFVRV